MRQSKKTTLAIDKHDESLKVLLTQLQNAILQSKYNKSSRYIEITNQLNSLSIQVNAYVNIDEEKRESFLAPIFLLFCFINRILTYFISVLKFSGNSNKEVLTHPNNHRSLNENINLENAFNLEF